MTDNRVPLTVALAPYSHAYEIRSGTIELAGIAARFVEPQRADADVRDVALAAYVRARLDGDREFAAVPVFLSRAFVHSWIYGCSDVERLPPADRTASIYARGLEGPR